MCTHPVLSHVEGFFSHHNIFENVLFSSVRRNLAAIKAHKQDGQVNTIINTEGFSGEKHERVFWLQKQYFWLIKIQPCVSFKINVNKVNIEVIKSSFHEKKVGTHLKFGHPLFSNPNPIIISRSISTIQ